MLRLLILSAALVAAVLADGTTQYNWQQHTGNNGQPGGNGNDFDWGQYTKPPGQEGTTYNWQQHTQSNGPGYDWGQHTKPPGNGGDHNGGNNGGDYDWGQHTKPPGNGGDHNGGNNGGDYDWGQHTKPPGNGGDHNGGNNNGGDHNGGNNNGGDHNGGNNNHTGNGDNNNNHGGNDVDNNNNNNNGHNDEDRPNFRCGSGTYTCSGTVGLCIKLNKVCDGVINCPHGDDEDRDICGSGLIKPSKGNGRGKNGFRGTGFMFHIGRMQIKNKSQTKLFNQNSDSQHFVKHQS